ncbi:MAG: ADP-glyceromanno-heptose 6-epimerase [Ignavibacteria bacterium]|nr:ADP-glyceromanno-heptose 6-epimerase [Ignavibacteria bacterium]MBP6509378.1 ADP-glyceromanno-heptose 6-epimerase [Candidatus Kapabacteria bacterium]MBK7185013.1 ADP-glyceromanno-heptose 6-epimerase [Ignavibacteria bacterium]MBK7412976.1 ADP-glyceromanno-heptose 6-epimerase [Ignavibacteria bacterium]MBK7576462.1 ADP-glyceromanno-heptose 6-epimerase [Ignavibacteria bacterium]
MIVLTGGAGFIGSCFLASLNAAGREDVLIVDSLGTGNKWKNLVDRTFIGIVGKEEFRDMMAVGDVEDVEAVVHMGACSSTTETDADYLYDNNYLYSIDVAEFAIERGARFIYASSAATYGSGSRGYTDGSTDLRPLNMYGYSKHLFDRWIREQNLTDSCVGLKFFNVFGPNEYHKGSMSSMVFKAVSQIHASGSVSLFKSVDPSYTDGGQMRDFVYVKDVCKVMMTLLERPDVNGIMNLGTGVARTWNDLMTAVFTAMGREPNIVYTDMPEGLAKQYQNFTLADMSTMQRALPDVHFGPLESTVADYVQEHLLKDWPYL